VPATACVPAEASVDLGVVYARCENLDEHFSCAKFGQWYFAVLQFVETAISRSYNSLHGTNTRDN
jgi:hypothetical protein